MPESKSSFVSFKNQEKKINKRKIREKKGKLREKIGKIGKIQEKKRLFENIQKVNIQKAKKCPYKRITRIC